MFDLQLQKKKSRKTYVCMTSSERKGERTFRCTVVDGSGFNSRLFSACCQLIFKHSGEYFDNSTEVPGSFLVWALTIRSWQELKVPIFLLRIAGNVRTPFTSRQKFDKSSKLFQIIRLLFGFWQQKFPLYHMFHSDWCGSAPKGHHHLVRDVVFSSMEVLQAQVTEADWSNLRLK